MIFPRSVRTLRPGIPPRFQNHDSNVSRHALKLPTANYQLPTCLPAYLPPTNGRRSRTGATSPHMRAGVRAQSTARRALKLRLKQGVGGSSEGGRA